jgi:hypothetical protein
MTSAEDSVRRVPRGRSTRHRRVGRVTATAEYGVHQGFRFLSDEDPAVLRVMAGLVV